jgi:hypothetical protein
MGFDVEMGGSTAGVSWYLLTGSAPLVPAVQMPGLWVGLMLTELDHPEEGAGPIGACGPVEAFGALIACIERSAHNMGLAEALSAATDQARATIADAVKGPQP